MKYIYLFALFGIMFSTSGCLSDSRADAAVNFDILLADSGPINGIFGNKKVEFIDNQISYDEAMSRYTNASTTAIDFSHSQVVLIDMGGRATGGYSLRVDRVEELNSAISITATEIRPGSGCFVSSVFTSPYVFVNVQSASRVRTIIINEETVDCNAP